MPLTNCVSLLALYSFPLITVKCVSKILYLADMCHVCFLSVHFLHHGSESGAVEPGSGDSIVREMGWIGKTVAAGVMLVFVIASASFSKAEKK